MRNTFFTSDQHFNHANVIKYCNRPFADVKEMNEALIEKHNAKVKPKDLVFFGGDFAFVKTEIELDGLLRSLNGTKIWVLGNHDRSFCTRAGIPTYFRILEVKQGGSVFGNFDRDFTLSHFPQLSWLDSHHGAFNLHGHTHGDLPFDPTVRRMDVGVDCNNYEPVAWEDIVAKLSKIPVKSHHDKKET